MRDPSLTPMSALAARADAPRPRTRLGRLIRDPLLHFGLIGIALFGAYSALNPSADAPEEDRIVLTQDDLRQMTVAWMAQGRQAPAPEQVASLVEAKVHEEILYREALALGLDRDDTIVKRRLAQKMDFLAEDAAALREPTRQELEAWFREHSGAFASMPRVSFTHVYFSADRHGEGARDAAAKALETLAAGSRPSAAGLGDPFMFQDFYGDRSPTQLAGVFGPAFAKALFEVRPGTWQGPIASGYGWHLVFIDAMTPSRVPAFEEVEAEVRTEWTAEQRARSKQTAFETMRARYTVVLPDDGEAKP
jgi:peptidyl-prolyl cis-trans isomerase C